MGWRKATKQDLGQLKKLIVQEECRCVSLASRMLIKGVFQLPVPHIATLFCNVNNNKQIQDIIMLTKGGLLLPLFTGPPSLESVAGLKKIISDEKRDSTSNIYCIMGLERDVRLLETIVPTKQSLYFFLMHRNLSHWFGFRPVIPPWIHVCRAPPRLYRSLFTLEKNYQLEEVLVDRNRFNHETLLLNLKRICKEEIVYIAQNNKNTSYPIAKVNTNARGIHYYQIGGVYTAEEYRRQGISFALMDLLLLELYRQKKHAVLFVKKNNRPALALYRKLLFRPAGEYKIAYT